MNKENERIEEWRMVRIFWTWHKVVSKGLERGAWETPRLHPRKCPAYLDSGNRTKILVEFHSPLQTMSSSKKFLRWAMVEATCLTLWACMLGLGLKNLRLRCMKYVTMLISYRGSLEISEIKWWSLQQLIVKSTQVFKRPIGLKMWCVFLAAKNNDL